MSILFDLFLSFFKIGLLSFGGGLAAVPLIQAQIVDFHHWISMNEFVDLITLAQMTPGPIAVNSATFVGIHLAGIPGALVATFGCILPSIIIVSILAFLYFKFKNLPIIQDVLNGLRPGVIALIASAGLSILILAIFKNGFSLNINNIYFLGLILFAISLFLLRKFKANPIVIMCGCGVVGICVQLIKNVI